LRWPSGSGRRAARTRPCSALATGHFKVGDMLAETSATREGLAMLERARVDADALVQTGVDPSDHVLLENILAKIGFAQFELRDIQGALATHRRVLALQEARVARDPTDNARMSLAMRHVILGRVLRDLGDLSGALPHHLTAIAIEEELVKRQPADALYARELRLAYNWTGNRLDQSRRSRGGARVLSQCARHL
jgi:hypothetical protein